MQRPVRVVDMFAGRGAFLSGEPGSPLIIAGQLSTLSAAGHDVGLLCYESYKPHFEELSQLLSQYEFANAENADCFGHVDALAEIANLNTTLLYVDPCNIAQLRLSQLSKIYGKIHGGSSVETVIVFMAGAFMRQALAVLSREGTIAELAMTDPLISSMPEEEWGEWVAALHGPDESSEVGRLQKERAQLDDVAGGDYWDRIARDQSLPFESKCEQLVDAYLLRLKEWFQVRLKYPIFEDAKGKLPKYWLLFGSRYRPCIDLFNRAACTARRKQGLAWKSGETLFADVPIDTSADPAQVSSAVMAVARQVETVQWRELRWQLSEAELGRFTDSEINRSIKRLLSKGKIAGPSGKKVEEEAMISIV